MNFFDNKSKESTLSSMFANRQNFLSVCTKTLITAVVLILIGGMVVSTNAKVETSTLLLRQDAAINQSTDVGGIISADTTWIKSNSPYIVTQSIRVSEGSTLTIEPGVEVQFADNYAIEVDGGLIARGTSLEPIIFTSNQTNPSSGNWGMRADSNLNGINFADTSVDATVDGNGNYISGSIIQYSIIEYGTGISINGAAPFIDNNIVRHSGDNGGAAIFYNGYAPGSSAPSPCITNNWITDNQNEGFNLQQGSVIFEDNVVIRSSRAYLGEIGGSMQRNTIACNDNGAILTAFSNPLTIQQNNIVNNGSVDVELRFDGQDLDLSNNYWGTTDTTAIADRLYDQTDNIDIPGMITYSPILTSPITPRFYDPTCPIPGLAIGGLVATNDSPTILGQTTTLTATVTEGNNITYTWALGDGETDDGMVVTHTYPAKGVYTATVTANNSASVVTATTTVTITPNLLLSKTGPTSANAGDFITYTLNLTNRSEYTMTNLIITDTIPAGATYINAPAGTAILPGGTAIIPGGVRVGDVINWTISSLDPGVNKIVRFVVTASTTITNSDYQASADGGFTAVGSPIVVTKIVTSSLCASTIQSIQNGNWDDADTWNLNRIPNTDDIVQVQAGHTITGSTSTNIQALCNFGVIQSAQNQALKINATGFISNYHQILGRDGQTGEGSACGSQGSSVELRGTPIYNEGTIKSGAGGNGNRCGGSGGSLMVFGRDTTNVGTICGGKGGDVLGTDAGQSGNGGDTHIWGKWGGSGFLRNSGFACAGDGGNSNLSATAPQNGGAGGTLKLISLPSVFLNGGKHYAGWGGRGTGGGRNGNGGRVIIEPNTISLSGSGTRVSGQDVVIFGGADWILDLSNMDGIAITATDSITLAVGSGGAVNLSGNANPVLLAGKQVIIASDVITLNASAALTNVVGDNVVTNPSRLLLDHSLTTPGQVIGKPGNTIHVNLSLLNSGPISDNYSLTRLDAAGWALGTLASPVTVDGLDFNDLTLDITIPSTAQNGDTNVITVTATSQTDTNLIVVENIEVLVEAVEEPTKRVYLPFIIKQNEADPVRRRTGSLRQPIAGRFPLRRSAAKPAALQLGEATYRAARWAASFVE